MQLYSEEGDRHHLKLEIKLNRSLEQIKIMYIPDRMQ